MAMVVLGSQWGDEGKGKLVDILCADTQLCARCQGGNNAGHTIVANGITYDFHILPSGLVNPACTTNLIGSGVVVHVPSFFDELSQLQNKKLDTRGRIFISDRAHVVFDLHQLVDGLEEVELGKGNIGTTRKGIGPCYSTKASRSGVRMSEVFDQEVLERKLRTLAEGYRKRFGDLLKYDVEEEISRFKVHPSLPSIQVADRKDLSPATQGVCRRCRSPHDKSPRIKYQDPRRGCQRHHARSGLRHIPLRDLVQHRHRRRFHRSCPESVQGQGYHRRGQSLYHTSWCWTFSHRAA